MVQVQIGTKKLPGMVVSHTHNLGFAGGAGNTSYSASVNFRNAEGVSFVRASAN